MNRVPVCLTNQLIVNLHDFRWSNPNGIMGIFTTAALFEAYCYTLWNSIGYADYNYAFLMEWVSEELGPNANGCPGDDSTPLISDTNFIMMMQQSVMCGFMNFVTENRLFVSQTLAPSLMNVGKQLLVAQDGVPNVMRIQYD